jgi:hypothetical protein
MVGIALGCSSVYHYFEWINLCFLLHLVRRLYETVYLFNSQTKMNVFHLLFGIVFYPLVWITITPKWSKDLDNFILPYREGYHELDMEMKTSNLRIIITVLVLNAAAYYQHKTHLIMARNRTKNKLPKEWMFELVVCPNFTFELLIYAGLLIAKTTLSCALLFAVVCLNQTISSLQRRRFYNTKIPAIIPFLI